MTDELKPGDRVRFRVEGEGSYLGGLDAATIELRADRQSLYLPSYTVLERIESFKIGEVIETRERLNDLPVKAIIRDDIGNTTEVVPDHRVVDVGTRNSCDFTWLNLPVEVLWLPPVNLSWAPDGTVWWWCSKCGIEEFGLTEHLAVEHAREHRCDDKNDEERQS